MSIQERKTEVMGKLQGLKSWEQRFKEILNFAKLLPPLPPEFRKDEFLVPGCLSKIWLVAEVKEGKIYLQADADAASMRGMVGLLVYIYSGSTPQEILFLPADFLKEAGVTQHLSMNRRNGIVNLYKLIRQFAENLVNPKE